MPIKIIRLDKANFQDFKLKVKVLQSERYVSDLHFAKEGTFYHKITNNDNNHAFDLLI